MFLVTITGVAGGLAMDATAVALALSALGILRAGAAPAPSARSWPGWLVR